MRRPWNKAWVVIVLPASMTASVACGKTVTEAPVVLLWSMRDRT